VAQEGVHSLFDNYDRMKWLGKQHPPLTPIVYGLTMRVLGVNIVVARFISVFFGTCVLLLTYLLGKKLYDDPYTGLLAALFLLSFPQFTRLSTIANNDILVTFCFTSVLLLFLYWRQSQRPMYMIGGALFLVAGLLSKYTMFLVFGVLVGSLVFIRSFGALKWHLIVPLFLSAVLAVGWLVYTLEVETVIVQIQTIINYLGVSTNYTGQLRLFSPHRMQIRLENLALALPNGFGVYNLPLLILGGLKLRRRHPSDLFILIWAVMVCVPLIITLPVYRYFLLAFPALAILIARGLRNFPEVTEQALLLALLYRGDILLYSFFA